MGIYDTSNNGTDTGLNDKDYNLEIDLADPGPVSGDFGGAVAGTDTDTGGTPIAYVFEEGESTGTPLGFLDSDAGTGEWTYTPFGTEGIEIGSTFSFSVTATDLRFDVTDTDTVTITFTCFAAGTQVDTPSGARAIEDIAPGDPVLTRDRGAQPVRWIGARSLPRPGALGAVVIGAGAMGNDAELRVSPGHRILIRGWRAQAICGEAEVLVAARDLINGDTIWQDTKTPVTYYHMLFDQHEIVSTSGVDSESYHPTTTGLKDLSPATRDEVLMLFPELAERPETYGPAARPTIGMAQASAFGL